MNEYEEIRENLENPNDKKLRDWLENNWLMLRKFFNATTEAIIKDDDFDFFMDLDYKVYKLIFGLFSRLAPTPKNAEVIHCIFENFSDVLLNKLRDTPLTDQDKITELLKKWHNKQDIQHKDYLYFYEHRYDYDTTCDSKFTKIEKKCGREDDYISCRFYLALMLTRSDEFEDFENSEDVALRMVFYKEYNFNWNEESYLTHEKLKAYYERDGKLALDYIIDNPSIYHRNEHLKLIIGNTGHIPTLNRIMENYDKVKNRKKAPWELAHELVDKIEKEELEEQAAEYKAKEDFEKYQKIEDNFIQVHKKVSNLQTTIIISFIIMLIALIIL